MNQALHKIDRLQIVIDETAIGQLQGLGFGLLKEFAAGLVGHSHLKQGLRLAKKTDVIADKIQHDKFVFAGARAVAQSAPQLL